MTGSMETPRSTDRLVPPECRRAIRMIDGGSDRYTWRLVEDPFEDGALAIEFRYSLTHGAYTAEVRVREDAADAPYGYREVRLETIECALASDAGSADAVDCAWRIANQRAELRDRTWVDGQVLADAAREIRGEELSAEEVVRLTSRHPVDDTMERLALADVEARIAAKRAAGTTTDDEYPRLIGQAARLRHLVGRVCPGLPGQALCHEEAVPGDRYCAGHRAKYDAGWRSPGEIAAADLSDERDEQDHEAQPCAECGRPIVWDESAKDYRHATGPACALALGAIEPENLNLSDAWRDSTPTRPAYTLVLIDRDFDHAPDGDFAYVRELTLDDVRDPGRMFRIRAELEHEIEQLEERDREEPA